MAGQIAELSRRTLRKDFRNIDTSRARIVLLDAAPTGAPAFGDRLGGKAAKRHLEKIGVEVQLGAKVIDVDATGIESRTPTAPTAGSRRCARCGPPGCRPPSSAPQLAEQTGAQLDRAGRVAVNDDLTLPGHPEIFVVGDMAALNGLPRRRAGRHPGRRTPPSRSSAARRQADEGPFHYYDKGSMATVSRFSAVAKIGNLGSPGSSRG